MKELPDLSGVPHPPTALLHNPVVRAAGDHTDPAAVKTALRVLQDGHGVETPSESPTDSKEAP
ncbi:hypothetical protein [Nocardioides sp.]|uniref:hypothetical protein n=1 Tax=Nocardioides sp. TaxID=35761 RepID=UPI0039E4F964